MDEHHDDHPIDPAVIEDLQQFLRNFKHKTTQPKMKKEILAKIEEHLSVLARLKDEEGLDSTFHVLLCSLSVVILENFPMYAVIDWVEKGNDDWEDDSPWDSFFLMPPYGFPAYVAPNRSANIRLPSSRWIVDADHIHKYSGRVRSSAPRPVLDFIYTTDSESEQDEDEASQPGSPSPPTPRRAPQATTPATRLGPPSSSKKNRKSVEDTEKAQSKGPATALNLNPVLKNSLSSVQQVSSRLPDPTTPNSDTKSSPSRRSVKHAQTHAFSPKATPRPASSSKSILEPPIKAKDSLKGEHPLERPKISLFGPIAASESGSLSSSSSEGEVESQDEFDEEDEAEGHEEPHTPRQTRAKHQKSKNGRVVVKEDKVKRGTEATPLSPSVKRSTRKRKRTMNDNDADADEDAFEAPEPTTSEKTRNKKGKKEDEIPDVENIYNSKGQRIVVAPYVDSLPSALLGVSDPILEELEGELVVAPCSPCSLSGKVCETQGFGKHCLACEQGGQPCDLEFAAVRRPKRVTASAGFSHHEYASANLSQLAADMEGEIASARILLAMAHGHAQRGKVKKDLIGSIVHRLIANTSEAHATDEVFGGHVEMFETFKRVFFQPLPSVGAGTFDMTQLLAAVKELSLVEFSKGASDKEPGAVDENGDIVEDAAMNGASRAPSPDLAPDDGDAPMEAV
ncbi:hypothetical protein BKA70DRAFT_1219507 [Coprinopsis sp. MPI-PUGE-AT-0042]|nr:hypothetical protein BKA70DRAFT_1219507 [Coprinopsis sp. MPI-PUGE-AT-0042]